MNRYTARILIATTSSKPMGKKTPLFECHVASGAKIVDFAGWEMPLHYGSQLEEHHQVRKDAGAFDVSHMTVVDLIGNDAAQYLRRLLANNVDRLAPGKALYTCMLNEHGGVIDDLIVYQIAENNYRLVVNSATREKDLAWMTKQATGFNIKITERPELAMIAVQGPNAAAKFTGTLKNDEARILLSLKPFHATTIKNWFVARTGYTGEDGFEIILPNNEAATCWNALLSAKINPAGLGARDTLRLEAGLNLYGSDMDENVTPLESNLGWTVAWDPAARDFIGRAALEKQKQNGVEKRLVGLVLKDQGVLRNHQKVLVDSIGEGEITSGSFSPTLNKGIALARVPAATGSQCSVEVRGKFMPAQVVKPPFVRQGKKTFQDTE